MVPAVGEDAAATLRTVDDAYSVDARRVAEEIALPLAAIGIAVGEVDANGKWKSSIGAVRIRGYNAFGQNCDARAFVGSHERGLRQEFRDVTVECGIPSDNGLTHERVHLIIHGRCASVYAIRIVRIGRPHVVPVE